MDDSRLFIEIGINHNGQLEAVDMTPYERWSTDIINHVAIERVIDSNSETVDIRFRTMRHERDYEYMRHSKPFDLPGDGMYTYQKLILPLKEHAQEGDCFYEDGKLYIQNRQVDFEEV